MFLSGSTVKRATLHNADQIELLDLHLNDMVFVEKGGEIIPKITGVDHSFRNENSQKVTLLPIVLNAELNLLKMKVKQIISVPTISIVLHR